MEQRQSKRDLSFLKPPLMYLLSILPSSAANWYLERSVGFTFFHLRRIHQAHAPSGSTAHFCRIAAALAVLTSYTIGVSICDSYKSAKTSFDAQDDGNRWSALFLVHLYHTTIIRLLCAVL